MARVNSLSLLAGTPIPIPEIGISLHQPRLKDIAMVGESNFYKALAVFLTKKENYIKEVERRYSKEPDYVSAVKERTLYMNDFQLILELLDSDQESKSVFTSFLFLIFPDMSKCFIDEMAMILSFKDGINEEGKPKNRQVILSSEQFEAISSIIEEIFASEELNKSAFNPSSDKAAAIAAKIEARRAKVALENGAQNKNTSMIATSISILSTISYLSLETILNYTLPQVSYQLERSKNLVSYETQMTLGAFAGLKDVEISDWGTQI